MLNATVFRAVLALVLTVGLASVSMAQPSADLSEKATGATSAGEMMTIAQQSGHVRVIVLFDSPVPPSAIRPEAADITNVMSQVAAVQDAIIAAHFGSATNPIEGQGFARGITRFPITPGFAVNVDASELEAFAADPRILRIQYDRPEPPVLNESVPLIGMAAAYTAGATGTGRTVAVLDTGIKATHEFLNGKVMAEACFSKSGGGGTGVTLCPNGTGSQAGVGAANANTAQCNSGAAADANLCFHGTHVAGIAAGKNTGLSGSEPPSGVAKLSNIFAIQVFTRFNTAAECSPSAAPCVKAFTSDQISALNHVFANLNPGGVPVASVNMSLGGGLNSGTCDGDTRKPAIDSLRAAGVLTTISSGNDDSTSQIGAPGCISTAVTVGSTTKTDVISAFSNMSSVVDLLAPGGIDSGACTFTGSQWIVGPAVTNGGSTTGYLCVVGTSQAAPHVAGAIAAIKSACPGATANAVETALKSTGLSVTDTRAGGTQTKPRIRVDLAVQAACGGVGPDLVVTSLTGPTTGLIGGVIDGMSVTVKNQGTAASGSYRLGFYYSTDPTITTGDVFSGWFCNMAPLNPGETATCGGQVGVPGSLSPAAYYLGAFADDLQAVSETNEQNNGRVADTGPIVLTKNVQFGAPGDIPVPADYDGDGKTDFAVYRPATGEWFVFGSASGFRTLVFGAPAFLGLGDIPAPADYDGDGKADLAVYRSATGQWFIFGSATGFRTIVFGSPASFGLGDTPVPADYDGDHRADLAVYRKATGEWFVFASSSGFRTLLFGAPASFGLGDTPVPADYDGDGRADLAVFRKFTGEWFVFGTATGFHTLLFGAPAALGLGDVPVPADYDGDGRADLAIRRTSNGTWLIFRSSLGFLQQVWGLPTDLPAPADFDGDHRTNIAVWRPADGTWFVLP